MREGPLKRLRLLDEECRKRLAAARTEASRRERLDQNLRQRDAVVAEIAASGPLGTAFVEAHVELLALEHLRACGQQATGVDRTIQGIHAALRRLPGKPDQPKYPLTIDAAIGHLESLRRWIDAAMGSDPPPKRRRWTVGDAERYVRRVLLGAQTAGRTVSLREIAAETGIPKSTIGRTESWKALGADARRHVTHDTDWAADAAEDAP